MEFEKMETSMGIIKPLIVVVIGFGILIYFGKSSNNLISDTGCKSAVNSFYQEKLNEAIADESKWRLGGYSSAQDYASTRTSSYKAELCN